MRGVLNRVGIGGGYSPCMIVQATRCYGKIILTATYIQALIQLQKVYIYTGVAELDHEPKAVR